MHELHSHRSAIDATGLLGELAFGRQIRVRHGPQKAKRIKVGFEISPTTECIEHTLALSVGRFQYMSVEVSAAVLDRVAIKYYYK